MGYIDKHLLTNEHVIKRGRVSMSAYVAPSLMLVLGLLTAAIVIGLILLVYAILAMVRLATTEVAVTDKRVIGKVGIFSTNSLDLRLTKLEGIAVRKGLFGAMFNYGAITVAGSGTTRVTFPGMVNPEGLRRAFLNASEKLEKSPTPQQSEPVSQPRQAVSTFEVQIFDQHSGEESWVQVKAANKDDALQRAANTGMIVGTCRLVGIE